MMKFWNRCLRALSALILGLSLGWLPVSAQETGTITLENPKNGVEYTAYKIFDVTYSGSNYAYTINGNSQWFSTANGYEGLTLTQSTADPSIWLVQQNDSFSAADFAAALNKVSNPTGGTPLTGTDTKTATGLDLGYYFVKGTEGSLCDLTTTNPTATIYDKNEDLPLTKTATDEDQNPVLDAQIGQTIYYTLTSRVPETTEGYETYSYYITDTMGTGLTFNKDVVLTIDGDVITEGITMTPDSDNATGFKFSASQKILEKYAGKEVVVTYSAVLNKDAVVTTDGNPNTAELQYSNNPSDPYTLKTVPAEEKVYTASIIIDKYAKQPTEDNTSEKLEGAKFILYQENEGVKSYLKVAENTGTLSWTSVQSEATAVVTDGNGAATFKGLKAGTYYLLETEAPAGYNLMNEPTEVVVSITEDAGTVTMSDNTVSIPNSSGVQLPNTGLFSTPVLAWIGLFLVASAGILLITKRRMALHE